MGDFFVSLVLNFGQVTKLLTEIVKTEYSLLEWTKTLMKNPKFWIFNVEICRKFQTFSKIWGFKTNFAENKGPIMSKFRLSESEIHFI